MKTEENLRNFEKIIFSHFLEQTAQGEEFLYALDTDTFQGLKEKMKEEEKVPVAELEKDLKRTKDPYWAIRFPIVTTTIQVSLIYDLDNINEAGYYVCLRNYYGTTCFPDDRSIEDYLRRVQEYIWRKTKERFKECNRIITLPAQKTGSGRYVQYPESQRVLSNSKIIDYADTFIKLHLDPYSFFTFDNFCQRVFTFGIISQSKYIAQAQSDVFAKKIIFSFYNQWDGRPTAQIKGNIQRNPRPGFKKITSKNVPQVRVIINSQNKIELYDGNNKIFQINKFLQNKGNGAFFKYDAGFEEYSIMDNHKDFNIDDTFLLLSVDNSLLTDPNFKEYYRDELFDDNYSVFIFDELNNAIIKKFNLQYDGKSAASIFSPIGGIRVLNYRSGRNFLGAWYDFALPKIKLNRDEAVDYVFIDSKEIPVENNTIDLDKLINESNLNEGEHSIKCPDTSPAFFVVEKPINVLPPVSGLPGPEYQVSGSKKLTFTGLKSEVLNDTI